MFDPEKFGEAMAAAIQAEVAPLKAKIAELDKQLAERPDYAEFIKQQVQAACIVHMPEAKKGDPGEPGIGVAGAMIDRDGAIQITLSNGEVKSLGVVVGKDGEAKDGINGKDGISFESFDMRYLDETSQLEVKATAGGITKEVRFHIGGMRGKGYWREGVTAKANEAWSYGGQLWIAVNETKAEPKAGCADWFLGARKGKDADTIIRTAPSTAPIRLGA